MTRAEYHRVWRATWRADFAVGNNDRKALSRQLRRLLWKQSK